MRSAMNVIGSLLSGGALGAAVVDPEAAILQSRLDDRVEVLRDLARSFEPVARSASPPLRLLELGFADRRLVLVPAAHRMIAFTVDHDADPHAILDHAEREIASLDAAAGTLTSEASAAADEAPEEETAEETQGAALLEVINRVSARARETLGGPVVRNYLKKARADLNEERLEVLRVDLAAFVSLPDGESLAAPATLGPAMRAWAEAFLARAAAVVPELAEYDLDRASRDLAPILETTGFPRSTSR